MSHETWLESAAAYAIDSLDSAEVPAFEAHLKACAECQRAVREFREVAALLAHAAPGAQASAGLRTRVNELVRADARGATRRAGMQHWLPAAAGVVLAVGLGVLWRRSEIENERLGTVVRHLSGSRVHVVSLAKAGEKPRLRVFWNHDDKRFIVTAFDLPPAREGRTYQLWAVAKDKAPVSMGTFQTDAAGDALAVLTVSDEIEKLGFIAVCALTEEPAGGSPAPTETPRLAGEWMHTD